MDTLKGFVSGSGKQQDQQPAEQPGSSEGGFGDRISSITGSGSARQKPAEQQKPSGGFGDKINGMLGGGKQSEKKEDYLDKAVDYVQEHVLGQGPQDNESAFEQAKDEQISDFIRGRYKATTGRDFPVADK